MSGTSDGSIKAAATNRELYGEDFYRRIGAMGGSAKVKKGFAIAGHAASAGRLGGKREPTEETRRRMSESRKAWFATQKLLNLK